MNLLLFAALLFCAVSIGCDSKVTDVSTGTGTIDSEPRIRPPNNANEMTAPDYEVAVIYTDLRNQVLHSGPETIGQEVADESAVYAVLMETGYPEAVATLVAAADGSASLYFSNGGGIIGGGRHEPVRKESVEFIAFAQQFVQHSTLTATFPLPKKDNVRCYLVTRAGVYTFEALEDDLGHGRHPCSAFFHKGHELIAAIREHIPE